MIKESSDINFSLWDNGGIMDLELLEGICGQCDLGTLESEPQKLKGGFLHKMYSLFTTKGRYAVKLLNPHIMQRETAMGNYRTAERFEFMLEEKGIPVIPSLVFSGKKMQSIKGQFFYLYDWYDGKALKREEITEPHCREIGKLLAGIHALDRHKEARAQEEIHIDWEFYIKQYSEKNKELYGLLKENLPLLLESQNNGNAAVKKLPSIVSVCHNDMDSKNVLWKGMDCRIIDLECLGYSSPFVELYELALCWSGYQECRMDYRLFRCFLESYAGAGGELPEDWETIYWSNYGRLEWLEYNMKRSLSMECAEDEIGMGISEVKNTMENIIYYRSAKEDILRNCVR